MPGTLGGLGTCEGAWVHAAAVGFVLWVEGAFWRKRTELNVLFKVSSWNLGFALTKLCGTELSEV